MCGVPATVSLSTFQPMVLPRGQMPNFYTNGANLRFERPGSRRAARSLSGGGARTGEVNMRNFQYWRAGRCPSGVHNSGRSTIILRCGAAHHKTSTKHAGKPNSMVDFALHKFNSDDIDYGEKIGKKMRGRLHRGMPFRIPSSGASAGGVVMLVWSYGPWSFIRRRGAQTPASDRGPLSCLVP